MFVEIHDPDGLIAHAQGIAHAHGLQYTADDSVPDVSAALTQSVVWSTELQDRFQKLLDGIPGMLVVNNVQTTSAPAWPEIEDSASESAPWPDPELDEA